MAKRKKDLMEKWKHIEYEHLVLATEEFIVFVDKAIDVDWETNDVFDKREVEDSCRRNAIINHVAVVECVPCYHLPKQLRLSFKRLLGEALARGLSDDYENAEKMVAMAETFITERNVEKARLWHVCSSGTVALLATIAGISIWVAREAVTRFLGATAFGLALAACAGALGALLSLSFRIGNSRMDAASGRGLVCLEGAFRVVAGMISGLLVAACVHGGLVFSVMEGASGNLTGIVVLGLVAGASERLAPSIVGHVEASSVPVEHRETVERQSTGVPKSN